MDGHETGHSGALRRAGAAMAWAGHPGSTWSIVLEARLTHIVSRRAVEARLADAVRHAPHLGRVPAVADADSSEVEELRDRFANTSYDGDAVTRIGLVRGPAPSILLAAHHGALDGLGLLGLLAALLDEPLTSSARGLTLGDAGHRRFALRAGRRVGEAVFHPPGRVATEPPATSGAGDHLVARATEGFEGGTVALVAATARAIDQWNRAHGTAMRRLVLSVGASRRPGTELTPEDRSTHLRVRLPQSDRASVAKALASTAPEPEVPPRPARLVVRTVGRLLSPRLGSTALVSNLGAVSGSSIVSSIAFWPVPVGRPAVALGAAGTGRHAVVTLRAGRIDFERVAATALLDLVCDELAAPS